MSATDEKAEAAVENSAESRDAAAASGPILLFFIVGVVASLIIGWAVFPKLLYSKKNQPIDFNHKLHLGEVEEGCQSCHFLREDGSFSGIPKLASCMECHEEVQGEDPNEKKFVEEYVQKEREVDWLVYARQPDNVFFSHAAHIKMAKIECSVCHGHTGTSESSRVYEANRLTGYSRDIWGKNIAGIKKNTWDRMKMDDCADCHAEAGKKSSAQTVREACFVCHK